MLFTLLEAWIDDTGEAYIREMGPWPAKTIVKYLKAQKTEIRGKEEIMYWVVGNDVKPGHVKKFGSNGELVIIAQED